MKCCGLLLYFADISQYVTFIVHVLNKTEIFLSLNFSVTLSKMFPDTLMLGMEIRIKVSDYVCDRIDALRQTDEESGYQNISCIRTNAMKYLPNYFQKGQVILSFHYEYVTKITGV